MNSVTEWLAFFYIYSVVGWVWETGYVTLCRRKPVNRGFLYGPFIPLYGFGAVSILVVALPLKAWPVLVYLAGLVTATVLELATGLAMERIFCVRYWDYSARRFQYRGYIWAVASLFWGFLALVLVEWIHVPVQRLVEGVQQRTLILAEILVTGVFLVDLVLSLRNAFQLRTLLQNTKRVRQQLQQVRAELSTHMDQRYANVRQSMDQTRQRITESRKDRRVEWNTQREQKVAQLQNRLERLQLRHRQQLDRLAELRTVMHRRHPTLHFGDLEETLRELLSRNQNNK